MTQQTVFITGASTGIGLATALQFDTLGWRVLAGVLPGENTDALSSRANVRIVPIDITKGTMIAAAAASIEREVGEQGLNGLINNAGMAVTGPMEFLPLDALRLQFEVNMFGHVAVTQAVLPLLRKARGRIVNTVSVLGRTVTPFSGAYCMSKHAMEAFTDALRMELRPWGIEVIAVEPGIIATPIWKKAETNIDEIHDELPPHGRELYGADMRKMRTSMARFERQGSPPQVVALAMVDALTNPKPKTRYLVGNEAALIGVLRLRLADRLVDWFTRRRYGL
ncbi:MAG: SDR family oxidoreductase [Chloroflexi bacterium]|nr:SDR family oxidoreductase [Chloroflexota bacterium]